MQVPEHNTRYCKTCLAFLPLDQFNPGPRRFYCKVHLRELNHRQHTPASAEERVARNLWIRCWKDASHYFGQQKVNITHKEVVSVLGKLNQTPSNYSTMSMLPYNPLEPLTVSNVFLATKPQRKYLVELWRTTKGVKPYTQAIQMFDSNQSAIP
jgi:hypothetical protein